MTGAARGQLHRFLVVQADGREEVRREDSSSNDTRAGGQSFE